MLAALTRLWIRLSILVLVAALLAPAAASAASASFRGWANLRSEYNGTSLDMRIRPIEAWRWTGTHWEICQSPTTLSSPSYLPGSCLRDGERVYAWPFGGGWHWVWTDRTGWVAGRSDDVIEPSPHLHYCAPTDCLHTL